MGAVTRQGCIFPLTESLSTDYCLTALYFLQAIPAKPVSIKPTVAGSGVGPLAVKSPSVKMKAGLPFWSTVGSKWRVQFCRPLMGKIILNWRKLPGPPRPHSSGG
jgi:hypothetical protein